MVFKGGDNTYRKEYSNLAQCTVLGCSRMKDSILGFAEEH